jgi:hypothetical protein
MSIRLRIKNAVLMVSLGRRPWARNCFRTFQYYGAKIGADAYFISKFPSGSDFLFPNLPDRPGRPNKKAYALKTYIAWKYIQQGYDRVCVVDDTCVAHPQAPNIFTDIPRAHLGYAKTNRVHAEKSFELIRNFQEKRGEEFVALDHNVYGNSGVVVYDADSVDAYSPEKIADAADLFYAKFPHQTALYYLTMKGGIRPFIIDSRFNKMPESIVETNRRVYLKRLHDRELRSAYFFHVTGAYRYRKKLLLNISTNSIAQWNASFRSDHTELVN